MGEGTSVALVKAVGADYVFDYNDSDCASLIKTASNDSIAYVFDYRTRKSFTYRNMGRPATSTRL